MQGATAFANAQVPLEVTAHVGTLSAKTVKPPFDEVQEAQFGGFSGLAIEPLSGDLVAVTDRGWVARFTKSIPPKILALELLGLRSHNSYFIDSEALGVASNGEWWVGFERYNRLEVHGPGWEGLLAVPTKRHALGLLQDLPPNDGIEALATLPDGRVAVIAEAPNAARMLVLDAGGRLLTRHTYQSPLPPTEAVGLPNGGLLVITRDSRWPMPPVFSSRLEYVAPGWEAQEQVQGRLLFRLDHGLPAENYEGMAVEHGPNGGLRLWLVSDDNLLPVQDSLLVRLDLPLACLEPSVKCEIKRR
ncbi:MAG: esterase-like activity of phytase family protein [Alphaproteobacteria bacterium]